MSTLQNSVELALICVAVFMLKALFFPGWVDVPVILALLAFIRFPPPQRANDRIKELEDKLANHEAIISNLSLKLGIGPQK